GKYVLPAAGTYVPAAITRLRLYDPATGAAAAPAVEPGGIVLDADVSPDGRLLVTVSALRIGGAGAFAPTVRFWDVASGAPIGDPIRAPSEPRGVRFRPDGGEVATVCAGGQVLVIGPDGPRVKRTIELKGVSFGRSQYTINGRVEYT